MRLLAQLRGLRGTPLDVFGYTEERRSERRLVADYFSDIQTLSSGLSPASHARALQLAELPHAIRGFGPVKAAAMQEHAANRSAWHRELKKATAVRVIRPSSQTTGIIPG